MTKKQYDERQGRQLIQQSGAGDDAALPYIPLSCQARPGEIPLGPVVYLGGKKMTR